MEIIVSAKYHIPWEGHEWDRVMRNKNTLLWSYDGANGVKTGFTKKAGRCFVGSAKRRMQLVSVVLNCGPMFEEAPLLWTMVLPLQKCDCCGRKSFYTIFTSNKGKTG